MNWLIAHNGAAFDRAGVPEVDPAVLARELAVPGTRLIALFGEPLAAGSTRLWCVVAFDDRSALGLATARADGAYPALTPRIPAAHLFERAIFEECGLRPDGHPWLKPVRSPPTRTAQFPAVTRFHDVEGLELHEVAVGPVHAGVIEPGHFRFQCRGEQVLHLEIALGYQHRGIERALRGGPSGRTIHLVETAAGDTSIGHATAYAEAIEGLASAPATPRAETIRAIALELERLANHAGDLGALAGDVAFLPAAAWCGRLRGEFLGLSALLCGSRLGRGLVRPGEVRFDIDASLAATMRARLEKASRALTAAIGSFLESPSATARLEGTGVLTPEQATAIGLVGPAARACGLARDVRREHPTGHYRFAQVHIPTWYSGDVFARALVRAAECRNSADFVLTELTQLPAGKVRSEVPPLRPEAGVVSLAEGWRGQICHVILTDDQGRIDMMKIVDPSFLNWTGLAMAMRGQQISDFPLTNKSFNLSYCGHDL